MQKAQSSLEYLLVAAGATAFFLLFLPAAASSVKSAFFALDALSAKSFASEMEHAAANAALLSDGTSFRITAKPFGEWVIKTDNNSLSVKVLFDGKERKEFSASFPNKLLFESRISEETVFFVKKENGKVLIENN